MVRPPAVAGRFYPAEAAALSRAVEEHLLAARPTALHVPRAIIAPHAGYAYSGPIAGSAFALLEPLGERLRRAIVIGPSHHIAFEGVATSAASAFRTPLGVVEVDTDAVARASRHAIVDEVERAHSQEHSLETHLPFLQTISASVRIVPLVIGLCDEAALAEVLDELWDEETILCVSSDLSHFEDYETATRHDAATSARITSLDSDIGPRDACGATAIRGLLAVARARALHPVAVDVRNSGDTAGGRDRVVGYGAYGFWSTV